MKTLYIECNMGAAGDMLMGALSEIVDDANGFVAHMNALGLPGVNLTREMSVKCGIVGTHMRVTVDGVEELEHGHDHAHDHCHGDEHDHAHDHCHGDEHGHEHEHCHGDEHDHVHEHCHGDEHDHEHDHCHGDEHDHEHDHMHAHGHDHAHLHVAAPHLHAHMHPHTHAHSHSAMGDIAALINGLNVSDAVKQRALCAYELIAEAESRSHGRPVEQIHFHEVGTVDAVADVVGVCELIERIAPERIVVSPINLGSGMVRCAHGLLPVPAPATAHILRGVPVYGSAMRGELCTPTGAALLRSLADEFGPMPMMRIDRIGYGMGSKDFPAANCVRVYLGESD